MMMIVVMVIMCRPTTHEMKIILYNFFIDFFFSCCFLSFKYFKVRFHLAVTVIGPSLGGGCHDDDDDANDDDGNDDNNK